MCAAFWPPLLYAIVSTESCPDAVPFIYFPEHEWDAENTPDTAAIGVPEYTPWVDIVPLCFGSSFAVNLCVASPPVEPAEYVSPELNKNVSFICSHSPILNNCFGEMLAVVI